MSGFNHLGIGADTHLVNLRAVKLAAFAAAVSGMLAAPLVLSGSAAGGGWAAPGLDSSVAVIAAGACMIAAAALLLVVGRHGPGELTLLALGFTVMGTLATAHALTTPGSLLHAPAPADLLGVLPVPIAVLAMLPLVFADRPRSRVLARHANAWSVVWVAATCLIASGALLSGYGFDPGPVLTAIVVAIGALGTLSLAARQLRLFTIGRRTASLVTAVAFIQLAIGTIAGQLVESGSPAWWAMQCLDVAAVLGGVVSFAVMFRSGRTIQTALEPVVNRDPLVALELGLTPEIHAFVAALDRKDSITRDHVVRVADLAMRVGQRADLPARRLRSLGLGALLHDIGKLVVPSDILDKPGALTDEEWTVMRSHTERGAALLAQSATLRDVAPLVRWHHERPDGTGYPDGITCTDLPVEVTIISVCDAFDAMTNARQYRGGMPITQAREVLTSGAGTQWTHQAVDLLLATVDEASTEGRFRAVGRTPDSRWGAREIDAFLTACPDAIPRELHPTRDAHASLPGTPLGQLAPR